ncbi:MAG: hypothetical protein ACYS67_10360 [Planctomycetota bacterium]|jgi:hypothetical protein
MKRELVTATFIAVLLCSFAGCTTYWYQEGKTFEECKQDYVDCFEDMKRYSRDPEDLDKYEFKLMEDCMILKGYRLVTERQLYVRVKREDPNLDVYWMVHGTAGFIREQE